MDHKRHLTGGTHAHRTCSFSCIILTLKNIHTTYIGILYLRYKRIEDKLYRMSRWIGNTIRFFISSRDRHLLATSATYSDITHTRSNIRSPKHNTPTLSYTVYYQTEYTVKQSTRPDVSTQHPHTTPLPSPGNASAECAQAPHEKGCPPTPPGTAAPRYAALLTGSYSPSPLIRRQACKLEIDLPPNSLPTPPPHHF